MIYELQKHGTASSSTGYYMKCSRCGFRSPVIPGTGYLVKVEAEQAERGHNLQAHGIATKGFLKTP